MIGFTFEEFAGASLFDFGRPIHQVGLDERSEFFLAPPRVADEPLIARPEHLRPGAFKFV